MATCITDQKAKNGVNKTYGAPGNSRKGNYGVKVEHDNPE
jgi:hypothetical protein